MADNNITITSALTVNPTSVAKASIRMIHIDPNDKSLHVEFDLIASDGTLLETRSRRMASPAVANRVETLMTFLTAALLTHLGVTGTRDA